jgi:hypothetical protein
MKRLVSRLAVIGALGLVSTSCIDDDSNRDDRTALSQTSADLGTFTSVINFPGGSVDFSVILTLTSSQSNGVAPYSFTWLRNGTAIPGCTASACALVPPVPGYGDIITLTARDATGSVSTDTTEVIGVCPGGGYDC